MNSRFKKIFRFVAIYGVNRTIYKALGRIRSIPRLLRNRNRNTSNTFSVGVIGCGQFSFATISYFLNRSKKYHIHAAYDLDKAAAASFANFNRVPVIADSVEDFFNEKLDLIYIASNHFSHTGYAIKALSLKIPVYIEKPICVNWEQFGQLGSAIESSNTDVFFGYNRPLSPAVMELRNYAEHISGPFSFNCFVTGHFIEDEHWYRKTEEGTRVCGNLGHWIDLSIHLLSVSALPEYIDIRVVASSFESRDDDLCVAMTTSNGDLITLTLTARGEPFEGINETINFAKGDLIAKIDDFRRAWYWHGDKLVKRRYFPKDVGHKNAILQHLNRTSYQRESDEVRLSTALMLQIKDMVVNDQDNFRFNVNDTRFRWKCL